jgi:hypothetical protein
MEKRPDLVGVGVIIVRGDRVLPEGFRYRTYFVRRRLDRRRADGPRTERL